MKHGAWLLVLTLALGCSERSTSRSEDTFELLLSYFAKGFPQRAEDLQRCKEHPEQSCLATYMRVQQGRARLFDSGAQVALERTLSALDSQCRGGGQGGQPPSPSLERCMGAGVALWYLSDLKSDEAVRHFLTTRGDRLAALNACTEGTPWAGNRPDRAAWLELVKSVRGVLAAGDSDPYSGLINKLENPSRPPPPPSY